MLMGSPYSIHCFAYPISTMFNSCQRTIFIHAEVQMKHEENHMNYVRAYGWYNRLRESKVSETCNCMPC